VLSGNALFTRAAVESNLPIAARGRQQAEGSVVAERYDSRMLPDDVTHDVDHQSSSASVRRVSPPTGTGSPTPRNAQSIAARLPVKYYFSEASRYGDVTCREEK
jgi:hypothetical protein